MFHYLWNVMKDKLTTKKTKDLVTIQAEKYKKIVEEMQKSNSTTMKPFENEIEKQDMENDLCHFLENLSQQPIP
jgi:hypothetical protein